MPDQTDDILEIPVPFFTVENGGIDNANGVRAMTPEDYGMMKMHALGGQQGQADGARLYAENLRYDYLEGKANVSLTEGLGVRYVQGPHPQFGTPDAKSGA